jgi:type II secretory pathway pseudopilin PulG
MKTRLLETGSDRRGGTIHGSPVIPARRKGQRAATLVEVVIATCILSIMGAGITSSIYYGFNMMRLARENARATQVMVEVLESVRLFNWSQVTSNGFIPKQFTNCYDPQGAIGQQGPFYYGSIAVSNCPIGTSYATNMRQMTVSLQWSTMGKIDHSRSMSTYISRDGIQNYVY